MKAYLKSTLPVAVLWSLVSVAFASPPPLGATASIPATATVVEPVVVTVASAGQSLPSLPTFSPAPMGQGTLPVNPLKASQISSSVSSYVILLDQSGKIAKDNNGLNMIFYTNSKQSQYKVHYQPLTDDSGDTIPISLNAQNLYCNKTSKGFSDESCTLVLSFELPMDIVIAPGIYKGSVNLVLNNS